ncbi:MAG TPA: hypothetical protein VK190_02800 [Pseudoneobacillus sp.]|nr:hypothetical protein [Pseudoneobacillus sp.]
MDQEIVERIDKLPKDGKHFTIEEIMEEELKKATKKDEEFEINLIDSNTGNTVASFTSTSVNFGKSSMNNHIYTMGSTTTSSWPTSHNIINHASLVGTDAGNKIIADGLTIRKDHDNNNEYEIDFDQVNSLDDMVLILKQMNVSFRGRDTVRGIEHLVKKK